MHGVCRVYDRTKGPTVSAIQPILLRAAWNFRQRNMPRRKQQAPKRLKAHEGDVETDDVSPGELADDESDDVEEKEEKEPERENGEERPKEVKTEKTDKTDEEAKRETSSSCLSPASAALKSPTGSQSSPTQALSAKSLQFPSMNGPMTMLSKMCTALSGTDSDSEDQDSDLEAMLRFSQHGMRLSQSVPEQEEALDLRVSKVKRRKDQTPHHERSSGKSKRSSDSSGRQSPSKAVKTVFCETVPRDVLASVSRLQTDYSVLPTQVSLCRGINGRCNFVLCTDCYQAFPNVGMLSLHLIATGHNSTKQLNSELMLQRGYLALVPPRTEFFSTCALRRKQRLPAASSRKELCAYTCSTCSVSFPDFLDYTVHLTTSGHDKQEKPNNSQSKPTPGDCPEEIPVNQVLKCMICQASFRTLKDLTMHMVRTKHYSHVPGHAGILLTRANAKPDEKGMDEAEEEDSNILDEEECQMAETLPATIFPKETDNLSQREQRHSESSMSSKEEVCQNTTKAALNQMLAARSQRVPASVTRSRSVDSDANLKSSKSRSLKCLGCSHLFANVHKLTEHMKETGHFLAPAFGHDASHKDRIIESDAPTNGMSVHMKSNSATRKLWADGETDNDNQQPGDKIKIVLKDGASKQQLLSVSSQNVDSESKKAGVRSSRTDLMEDLEGKSWKKLQNAASAESVADVVKRETPHELPGASELPHHSQKSPSPHASLTGSSIRYVNPDNFDELFPTNLSHCKVPSTESSMSNPLDKLTSMVETARETNFPPRLLSNHHHPYYHHAPWMPLVETPQQQQFVNGGGVFPSYAGLAMVYNALSLATSPSEAMASKMEKHLAAKESENVTVAEAIDKILSHSFGSEEKPNDPHHSPKMSASTRELRPGKSTEPKPNVHEACPSTKTRVHMRRSSRNMRSERLKRATNTKESVTEHHIHRKIAKRRHSLPTEAMGNSISKGIVTQPKCSGKNIPSLKSYQADIQRVDQGKPSGSESKSHTSSSGNKQQMVRATTVSVPVHRNAQKKGIVSMFMKKSGSSSSPGQEKSRIEAPKEPRSSRSSSRRHEHLNRHSLNDSLVDRHARMRAVMHNHTTDPHPRYTDPKLPRLSSIASNTTPPPDRNTAHPEYLNVTGDNSSENQIATEKCVTEYNGIDTKEKSVITPTAACSSHDTQNDHLHHSPTGIEIKKEKHENSLSSKSLDNQKDAHNTSRDIKFPIFEATRNHLNPKCKASDKMASDMDNIIPESRNAAHNGETHYNTHRGNESITHDGHISRLKRSLEMYKMFCEDSHASHEKRPSNSDGGRSAVCSPSKNNTPPSLASTSSGVLKIKQEPGDEVQKCPINEQDCRSLKNHGVPMRRVHNNNTVPCSTESTSTDSKATSKNLATPDSPTNSVLDNRKSADFSIGNSELVKFSEAPMYPNSDPLHEIDKLVNSTTGIQHPPVPPKIARISVDVINRGTYLMKREPEIYVNPGTENIKTNPLEEMCKMLNATRR